MQETSKLYKTLIAERGHVKEHRLLVAGEEYTGARIVSMESEGGLFEQDTVCVGGAVSRQLDVVLRGAGEIPKGAKLIPESRVRLGDQVSEWVKKGTFYIDTREPDPNLDTLTIHAFDDFLHMETPWIPDQSLEFPMPMDRAAAEVARSYGIEIDPRSRLRSDYTIDYPVPGTTGRDIFRHIAAAHGGNWTMTDLGMARLIRLGDMAPETGRLVTQRGQVIVIGGFAILVDKESDPGVYDGTADKVFVGVNAASVVDPPALDPISKIIVIVDDENYYEAGDDSGRTLEVTCPYGTQTMADDLLKDLRGYRYKPLEAQDALIDPAAELGDGMTVNGVYTVLAQMATTFDLLMPSDIGAPGQREIESETGNFTGRFWRAVNLSLARTRSLITKTAEQIRAEVKNEVEGLSASIDVQLGVIDEQVNGLDGRLGEVEVTAESVTQRVNGLDDAYAQIRTEVGSITSEVHELGGRMTLAEQTAEGFSREIDGLGGRFTKIEETIEGLTVSGPGGSTLIKGSSIETGSLQLTGLITWGDLDDDVSYTLERSRTNTFTTQPVGPYYVGDLWYKDDGTVWRCKIDEEREGRFYDTDWEQIQDAGLTEDIVHTLITGDLVESPTIRGAEIEGGQMNINNNFVVDSEGNLSIGGNIDLSGGTITWGDNKPESGITEERAAQIANDAANDAVEALASGNWVSPSKTFISEKKLESPEINAGTITGGTISGANIYGGTFKNQDGTYWIELGNTGHDHVLRLYKSGQEDVPLFSVGETDGFVYLNAHGYPYLTTEGGAYTISHPLNEWDFSLAQVTGLTAVFA